MAEQPMEAMVETLSEAAMFPVPPLYRAGVARNYLLLMAQARLVLDLPIPDETEPAALFQPVSVP